MLRDQLSALLEPLIEDLGYELVWLDHQPQGRGSLVRLYIDAVGGIDLGDCERVSREVSAALDVADPIPGNYRLEVSSPGSDRPLAKPEHFERFAGSRVRVQTHRPIDGRRRFVGQLKGLEAGHVVVEVDGVPFRLPLEQVDRARLAPDYGKES
jgi:ribosome maturation factor RimP